MSILIKGMEMPKVAGRMEAVITILKDGTAQIAISPADDGIGYWKEYPLIFVPPHGRLIDADALDDVFTELRWDSEGLVHWGDRNEWCLSGNEVEELFNNAPTVIPAEGE